MDISEKDLVSKIAEINPCRGEVYLVEIDDPKATSRKAMTMMSV
ncbi:MAG: hypothetical protein NY202_02815 [Mollicutes bacterium UO1]